MPTRRIGWLALVGLAAADLVAWGAQPLPQPGATAQLHDATGRLVATAEFRQGQEDVLVGLIFPDPSLLTGTHALHIHERGRCDPPDFTSSGGIFNPFGKQHGLLNNEGPMAGDLERLVLGPLGLRRANVTAPLVTLAPGPASLLGQNGTTLVIHARTDDDRSQPEGGAGARIACGVITAGAVPPVVPVAATASPPSSGAEASDRGPAALVGAAGVILLMAGITIRRLARRASPRRP